jgi:phosphatidylserine/phosphatidylglycerophosphate/cardiolipin synthase-like enzyme
MPDVDSTVRFRHASLGALVAAWSLLFHAGAASAANTEDPPTLEVLWESTNAVRSGSVKDSELRLYFVEPARSLMFQASWKHSRAGGDGFWFASAALEAGKPQASSPKPPSGWRAVAVLSKAESERSFQAALNRLVPAEPGGAIHARYALGDALLFRDPAGKVQIRPGGERPAGIQIQRRYNQRELASAAAKGMEAELRSAYSNQTAFVLSLGTSNRFRLAYLDFAERRAVVLYVPPKSDDPGRIVRFGTKLSNLASFIVIDHLWTFLKNPVSASGRTLNQLIQWPTTVLRRRLHENKEAVPVLVQGPGMDPAVWEEWLDHHTHTSRESGSVRLLIDGDQFFPVLKRRVAEAQRAVNIHVCIFDRDDAAVDVADELKKRSTNVEAKVVFDRGMSRHAAAGPPATPMPEGFTPPSFIGQYLRSGSRVRVRPQPNPAFTVDHSKIMLIDGHYGYIGGMNIGREYRYEWHDLMAEIQGPVLASFQRQFEKKWAQVGPWGDLALAGVMLGGKSPGTEAEPAANPIELRRLYTKSFRRQIRQAELAAINRASNRIYAENPYFFSNEFLRALTRARLRGVDVRVVMPSESDIETGHKSNLIVANYLLSYGVRVFFYPGMTHVKALLVDDWACFGSANFDDMSLRLNREANVASSNLAFARRFKEELFEVDFARSRELREPLSVGWSDYLADALMTPF